MGVITVGSSPSREPPQRIKLGVQSSVKSSRISMITAAARPSSAAQRDRKPDRARGVAILRSRQARGVDSCPQAFRHLKYPAYLWLPKIASGLAQLPRWATLIVGMIDLLKLLGGLLVGVFRSHAAREAEMAFLRQQLVVLR